MKNNTTTRYLYVLIKVEKIRIIRFETKNKSITKAKINLCKI